MHHNKPSGPNVTYSICIGSYTAIAHGTIQQQELVQVTVHVHFVKLWAVTLAINTTIAVMPVKFSYPTSIEA